MWTIDGQLQVNGLEEPMRAVGTLFRATTEIIRGVDKGGVPASIETEQIYRGTLVTPTWSMSGFLEGTLAIPGLFRGRVRIHSVDLVDGGRSYVLGFHSIHAPALEPPSP